MSKFKKIPRYALHCGNTEFFNDSYVKFMEEVKEINGTILQYSKEFNKNTRKMIKSRLVPQSWIEEFKSKSLELTEGAGVKLDQFKDILNKVMSKETEGVDYIILNGIKQYI